MLQLFTPPADAAAAAPQAAMSILLSYAAIMYPPATIHPDVARQAAMSMLLGFRSEILDTADALEPRNLHNGATWPYPPLMLMRIMDDEKEVVERCNKTIVVMSERVRARAGPCAQRDARSMLRIGMVAAGGWTGSRGCRRAVSHNH